MKDEVPAATRRRPPGVRFEGLDLNALDRLRCVSRTACRPSFVAGVLRKARLRLVSRAFDGDWRDGKLFLATAAPKEEEFKKGG